ncbi:hypothetical protein ANRL2_03920 [Anaerolineae bacterium]|nr:hypothetical protein ANRL2_03920 [Anaerolineae bacterium]
MYASIKRLASIRLPSVHRRVVSWRMATCLLGILSISASQAQQGFPNKPIRIISPFAAGSSTDLIARIVGQKLSENIGQPVIVDTRPGANGIVGAELVMRAAPDGYTLILASNGILGINVSLFNKLPYDPLKDFAPITVGGFVPYFLLVSASSPVPSVKELIALAKANPGKHTLSSAASVAHLTGELFKLSAGIDMTHVPYKSPANAFTDLISGQVDAHFEPLPSALPQVKGGRVKALAITTARRSSLAPEVPTIAESGFSGFESTAWIAFLAPAGTPKEVIGRLNSELTKAFQTPEVKDKLQQNGLEVQTSTPEQLTESIKAEIAKWVRVFREAKLNRM